MLSISKSDLLNFLYCKRKFELTKSYPYTRSIAVDRNTLEGKRFHEWAWRFFELSKHIAINKWHELIPPGYEELYRPFVDREIKRYKLWRHDLYQYHPLFLEVNTSAVDDEREIEYRGIIDRVDQYDEQTALILEYKTGKPSRHILMELAFYERLFRLSGIWMVFWDKEPDIKVGWYNPFNDELVIKDKLTKNTYKKLDRVIDSIIKETSFPKTDKYYKCADCQFRRCCWGGVGEQED